MRKYITILALVLISGIVYAQKSFKLDVPTLPPLETLIDSAVARAPMRGYQSERRDEAQDRIRTERQQWTDYVGVESYYRYGRLGIVDQNNGQGGSAGIPIVSSTNQSQSWWYVGAYLRIPIFAIINPRVEISRLRHTVRQSEYLMADAADAVTLRVIELYNDARLNIDILQIKASLLETNNAQIAEAENQYENRKIDLSRLAQLQEMQAKAATEFTTARYACRTALAQLQALTGVDIIGSFNFNIVHK